MNLDEKDKIVPTPLDSHEQVVPQFSDKPAEYELQEYPKVIGTTERGELIIAELRILRKGESQNLDGTDNIRPTPFDAHEQVVRYPHTHSPAFGYKPAEYVHQEYPKQVGTTEGGEPIIANSEQAAEAPETPALIDEPVVEDETSEAPKAHKPARHR